MSYTLFIKKQAKKILQSIATSERNRITEKEDYEVFDPSDYVENPIALARIKVGITQKELAELMAVTQAYISKIENQKNVTPKLLQKVQAALKKAKISK